MKTVLVKKASWLHARGISVMEVLIAIAIVGCCVSGVVWMDRQKWASTLAAKQTDLASRGIEAFIERTRMRIKTSPTLFFPPRDTTFTVEGIAYRTTIGAAYDNQNPPASLANVRKIVIAATWLAAGRRDTVEVTTCISRSF